MRDRERSRVPEHHEGYRALQRYKDKRNIVSLNYAVREKENNEMMRRVWRV